MTAHTDESGEATSSEADAHGDEPRSRRAWWIAATAVAVVVAAAVTGIVLARGSGATRGEATPSLAAQRFTAALNAGDKEAAAAASCANFADEARSAAAAGADPGIDFTLGDVRTSGPDVGSAVITQRLHFPGTVQREPRTLRLDRTDGKWLICGQN